MPTEAPPLHPAEQAIADSKAAYKAFLDTANAEVFEPASAARSAALNPIADAFNRTSASQLSAAAQQATGATSLPASQPNAPSRPRLPDGRFAPQANQQPPAAVAAAAPVATPPAPSAAPAAQAAIPGPPALTQPAAPPSAAPQSTPAPAADPFADVPAATAFDQPGAASPRSEHWKRLHAKADAALAREQQLTQQVEAYRAQVAAPAAPPKELTAQLATVASERDALLAKLEAVAVERSPRFESMFKPRHEAAITQATQAAGAAHGAKVKELLALPESSYRDGQLNEIIQDLGPGTLQANKLMAAVANIDQLTIERNAMAAKSADLYKQWQAEELQQQSRLQTTRQQAVATTFDTIVKDWTAAGLNDGDVSVARNVFMGASSLDDAARAAMWAVYGPKAAANALQLQQQLDAANTELARYRNVQPGVSANQGSIQPTDDHAAVAVKQGMYSEGIVQEAMKLGLPWR